MRMGEWLAIRRLSPVASGLPSDGTIDDLVPDQPVDLTIAERHRALHDWLTGATSPDPAADAVSMTGLAAIMAA